MSVKNLTKTRNLDTDKYVNIETGQVLGDDLPFGTTITITEPDDGLAVISSDEYIVVDASELKNLVDSKIITSNDMGKLLTMAMSLKTIYNALYKSTVPHTLETLSLLLDQNYDYTTKFIKKLCRKNVMHKYVTADDTLYCINPYLTRRRKTLSKDLLSRFSKFKK